jgi:hypothetical protein
MSNETFDPDPRRRGHKGRRKGGLPKSIISKYGISKRAWQVFRGGRTHDPSATRRRKPWHRGPRGGKYWKGPTKRRYDTPRFARVRHYGRHIGGKLEGWFNRFGTPIGAGLAALAGIGAAINTYNGAYGKDALSNYFYTIIGGKMADGSTRPPEIMHLIQNYDGWTPLNYLQYKFLGIAPDGRNVVSTSAWVIPFWVSLIGLIVSKLPIPISGFSRIKKPLGKLATGALVISTIGALALPGCPDGNSTTSTTTFPTTTRTELSYYR